MWDSNAPLQLLKAMPKKLTKENLEKIQLVIDADKYKNSLVSGFDLCGMYAPFCENCKKTSIYPCALEYIKMMQAQGMDVEIDVKPVSEKESKKFEKNLKETPAEKVETAEKVAEPEKEIELPKQEVVEETAATSAVEEEEQKKPQTTKRKIRIAVARKKIF